MRAVQSRAALFLVLLLATPGVTYGQAVETVGVRAQGMGNAFVGVADDATAVFWNPAGLAGGAFFSLVLDATRGEATPDGRLDAGRRSGWLLAASIPALGLAYYRLGRDAVVPVLTPDGPAVRRDTLVTHQVGASLVQSLTDHIAVGATLKGVRGMAASAVLPTTDRIQALRRATLLGRSSTRFDVDAGIMADGPVGRVGLTVRNLLQPGFSTGAAAGAMEELRLERQVRAGGSVVLWPSWRLASDLDLTRQRGPLGDVREWAIGSEAQVTRRLTARAGVRINTAGDAGRAPALSAGGSFAVLGGVMIDGQVTTGSDAAFRGWGLAGRMVF